jgi:spermidine/putrescine-binding protein
MDVFDGQDTLETRLLTGGSGYDVAVVASDEMRAKLVPLRMRTEDESRAENRSWTRFRTGQ